MSLQNVLICVMQEEQKHPKVIMSRCRRFYYEKKTASKTIRLQHNGKKIFRYW